MRLNRASRGLLFGLLFLVAGPGVARAQNEAASFSKQETLELAAQLADRMLMPFDRRAVAFQRLVALLQSGRFSTENGQPIRGLLAFHAGEGGVLSKVTSGTGLLRWKRSPQYWVFDLRGKSVSAQLGGAAGWGFGVVVGAGDPNRFAGDYVAVSATGDLMELTSPQADLHRVFLVGSAAPVATTPGAAPAQLTLLARRLADAGPPVSSAVLAPYPNAPGSSPVLDPYPPNAPYPQPVPAGNVPYVPYPPYAAYPAVPSVPAYYPPQPVTPATPPTPMCRMGSDGMQACGYHCVLGANGRAVCANTPDGVCAMNADGSAVCSQVQPGYAAPQPGPAPSAARVFIDVAARRRAAAPVEESGQRYCRSSIDCAFGQFCKDRGDSVNVCMGKGGNGASCTSSIDCGFGLFCRDRGDGWNVCM